MQHPARLATAAVAVVAVCAVLGACWLGLVPESSPTSAAPVGRRLKAQLAAQAEHDILALIAGGQAYVQRWDLEKAEMSLSKAARLAEMPKLTEGHAADPSFHRASLIEADALTQLGTFKTRYGEPSQAVPLLRRALEVAQSSPGEPTAVALRARAETALGRALCILGGRQGKAVQEALRHFEAASEAVQAARRAKGTRPADEDDSLVALETQVRVDHVECLIPGSKPARPTQADLLAAKTELEVATHIPKARGAALAGQTALRLLAARGLVLHEGGKFAEAIRLYDEYLTSAPAPKVGHDSTGVVQVFEVSQNKAFALASLGRIDEALGLLVKVEEAQMSVHADLRAKSQKFLVGSPDRSLWESMGRTHIARAMLLLTKGDELDVVAARHRYRSSQKSARRAVEMLRAYERSRSNLADGLNYLAAAFERCDDHQNAVSLYEEGLKIDIELYGEDSVLVAALLQNLANAKANLGRGKEALAIMRRALERDERVLGFAHPDTSLGYRNIAQLLQSMGDKDGALEAARRSAESARLALPEGDRNRLQAEQLLESLTPTGASSRLPATVVIDVSVVKA